MLRAMLHTEPVRRRSLAGRPPGREPAGRAILAALLLLLASIPASASTNRVVLCLGDSLTAGYGLAADKAWPALVQEKINQAGWSWTVVNAGVSGDTTAGGLRRLDPWLASGVDAVVLALGGNDGLRGFDPAFTERNLRAMVEKIRARHPHAPIVLAGMQMPPNLGPVYTQAFRSLYPRLAAELDLVLWPFMLESVAGQPDLLLPDALHPNAEGQRRIADAVWPILVPLLSAPTLPPMP